MKFNTLLGNLLNAGHMSLILGSIASIAPSKYVLFLRRDWMAEERSYNLESNIFC